jgi:hypothetical protein
MHPAVVLFMMVWFTGVIGIGSLITMAAVTELVTGRHILEGNMDVRIAALFAPGMLVFGVALTWFGWWMGKGQRQCIEAFIENTLAAHRLTSA